MHTFQVKCYHMLSLLAPICYQRHNPCASLSVIIYRLYKYRLMDTHSLFHLMSVKLRCAKAFSLKRFFSEKHQLNTLLKLGT